MIQNTMMSSTALQTGNVIRIADGWLWQVLLDPASLLSVMITIRLRRGALNSFFSKRAVTQLEPVIQEKVDKLCRRFRGVLKTGEVIRAHAAYVALTMDVISQYSFARDDDYLSEYDFRLAWKETLEGAFEGGALLRQFPWMLPLMNSMPES